MKNVFLFFCLCDDGVIFREPSEGRMPSNDKAGGGGGGEERASWWMLKLIS